MAAQTNRTGELSAPQGMPENCGRVAAVRIVLSQRGVPALGNLLRIQDAPALTEHPIRRGSGNPGAPLPGYGVVRIVLCAAQSRDSDETVNQLGQNRMGRPESGMGRGAGPG